MNKEIKKIFLVLILCSLADGFFYNFQQLWMQDNNLSIKTIGTVLSLASLLSVSVIFLCSNLITQNKIKKFLFSLISIKIIVIAALYFLNNTGLNILIKFLIMFDYVIDIEIYASIYPMISLVEKDDKKYALKTILYEGFYFIAVLISTITLGKTISFINITYNSYLLISLLFLVLGLIILKQIKLEEYYNKLKIENNDLNIMNKLFKTINKNKSIKNYLLFQLTNNLSYSCLTGLLLITLINSLGFSQTIASYSIMIMGISSSILGAVVLKIFTFKNDYINLSIKFVTRFILYVLAFLTGQPFMILIALIFTRISGSSYMNITNAPYVNMIETKNQLAFCNLTEMIAYLGKSAGTFICGIASSNLKYNFAISALFTGLGIYFAFKALYLRNKKGA